MSQDDETKALLQKLCILSEQQLATLTELSNQWKAATEANAKSRERWESQASLWEQSQKSYEERADRHDRVTRIRAIITLIFWAAIAIAVIVHYFF